MLVWRGLAPYLWPYRGRALMALGALLLAAGVILAGGHQLRFLIDRGFGTNDPDILHRSILILWGGAVLLAIGSAARYYLVTWLGERVIADIRRDYMRHIISLDAAYYEGVHTGAALSTFTSDTAVVQSVVGSSLSVLLRNTLLLTGGGILLFLTSTKLTLLILFLVPVVVLPILFFGRQVRQLSKKTQSKLAEVSAGLGEVLSGIKTVQAFVREPYEFARFSRNNEDVFFFASKRMLARAILTFSVILLIMTGISVILWVGSRDVVSGNVSGGDLAAFVFYAIIVASSFGAIGEQFAELQRAAGAMDRILATLSLKPQITSPLDAAPLRQPTRGAVTFTKVNFSYPSRPENAVLRDFSLDIAPGEKLAIVGPSGAGKTTLFQLLLRFFDPVSGVVAFDGLDLRHLALADLRQAISIVSQDPVLFSSSIEENIRYGHPDASKDDILKAAKLAHATEFIELLPKGFATEIGERGVTLSGGQRQRIAIARAILRDPALLLLDEATSALDSQSEKAVQEALDAVMLGRTTVIIAHRLSTILKADRIVVLNNGRIEDTGRHGDLINKDGLYTHLANLQFGLELPPKN